MGIAEYIEAGQIVSTSGLRGEVRIFCWLDSPAFLKRFRTLYIDGAAVAVRSARVYKNFVIASLAGVDDVEAAMRLKDKVVWIARADAHLPEGGFFYSELIGARVVTEQGETLGTLSEVWERPGNNVYVVTGGEREHMIPAVPEFILHTDVAGGQVTVRLIDGM